jgi:ATP-dependent RNA helicase DeaD
VWFRLTVGRQKNADPKWLIPLICRLGHVTKKDIGQIRIFDRETKFEIARDVAERFGEAVKAASAGGDIRVEPAGAPDPKAARGPAPRPKGKPNGPPFKGKPGGAGFKGKPGAPPFKGRKRPRD